MREKKKELNEENNPDAHSAPYEDLRPGRGGHPMSQSGEELVQKTVRKSNTEQAVEWSRGVKTHLAKRLT
jgi:hypothetical protein